MRILRSWLSDYVDFDDLDSAAFSELITTRVAEVDRSFELGEATRQAIVARIASVRPHPHKEQLTLVRLQLGGEEVEVVCGAPNVQEGAFAAYLPPGSVMRNPNDPDKAIQVESREVAGVVSQGVLVSEAELGLSGSHQGLMLITEALIQESQPIKRAGRPEPGAPLERLFPPDLVIEIDNKSLTHRPDLWSHFGFAREIAAVLGRPLKQLPDQWADDYPEGCAFLERLGKGERRIEIEIEPGCGCRRFAGLLLEGVHAAPSPLWIRRRLYSIGAGVRNVLVDLSNYVMHDIGQPNHAYDADRLGELYIKVRNAQADEVFQGLDGAEYRLTPEDIVIAGRNEPVALGGVMGGGPTAVADTTTRLLLESANFDPVKVRRTAKRQQLRTDASNRFEKSLSAYGVPLALHRFTELLCALSPQAQVASLVTDCFPEPPKTVEVAFSPKEIRQRLGADISDDHIRGIVKSLAFTEEERNGMHYLRVPYYRATRDISIEQDLVEEVGRIFGYENVPELPPGIASEAAKPRVLPELEHAVRDSLAAQGFSELYNYSFMHSSLAECLGYPLSEAIAVENTVDTALGHIRTTLIPGMLEAYRRNARFFSGQYFFEVGRVYENRPEDLSRRPFAPPTYANAPASERRLAAIGYSSGLKEEEHARFVSPPLAKGADFYALMSAVGKLCSLVSSRPLTAAPIQSEQVQGDASARDFGVYRPWMHPFRAASLQLGDTVIGHIAEVHPELTEEEGGARLVFAEVDLELLLAAQGEPRRFVPLPRFPWSFFEMSVVMPSEAPYRDIEQLLRKEVAPELLKQLEVVAVYEGKPLNEGEKSVSVRLTFGADDRTLSGEEIQALQEQLMTAVERSYSLRR